MAINMDANLVNAPRDHAAPVDAHDFKQFAALRRGANANDPATLREVARQFESIFTKMMLDSMRSASFGDPLFGSDQTDMYRDMMDDQLAVQLTQGRGIGLADMLIRQLSHSALAAPDAAPDGAGPRSEAAAAVSQSGSALPVDDEQRRRFIAFLQPHAEAAGRELGVDPRAVIAQAALETGWGRSRPADATGNSNNFFGIKAGASWKGERVSAETTEYLQGQAGRERAQFRAYGSVAENVGDYVRLVRDNPRYSAALNTGGDVRAFASALQRGGYATDPAYADKLVAVAGEVDRLGPGRFDNVNSFKSEDAGPINTRGPSRTNGNG